MRNLNLLNRFLRIQNVFITKNIHHHPALYPHTSSSYTCNVLAVQSLRSLSASALNSPLHHYLQNSFRSQVNHVKGFASAPLNSADTAPTTLEEFRARETAREEAENQKESDEEKQKARHEKDAKAEAVRFKILEAALHHVPSMGWTRNAIIKGAEDAGFPGVAHGLFPEGGFALVAFFNGKCNDELVKFLRQETNDGNQVPINPPDLLTVALQKRLQMIEPYKQQWPQALGLISLPQNTPTALAQLLTLVDDICYFAGDRSVDMGWYTRRIGLATIFKITELYMLQDMSPQHSKTWDFLNNRMEEAIQIQNILVETSNITDKVQTSFGTAFVTARNMLGLGGYTRH